MVDQTLLIITHLFPDKYNHNVAGIFIKEQLKFINNHFQKIYVISPRPYGFDLCKKQKYADYTYGKNIDVRFPRYLYSLLAYRKKKLDIIQKEYRTIDSLIQDLHYKFDLIHSHFTWRAGIVGAMLKRDNDIPLVITEHSSETFKTAITEKSQIFIDAWHESDKIIRVRKEDISLFEEVGIDRNKIQYIPNGFDPEKFRPIDKNESRKKLALPKDKKIILSVGSLDRIKGHEFLISAMKILSERRKDLLCLIVGNGPLRRDLLKAIHDSSLENIVKLIGSRPHDEIPFWMNSSDLLVLPSLNEGNPTVMFEALGCGIPIVGTKVGGIPEIIFSDEYGMLCEPGNSRELADVIDFAISKKWDIKTILEYSSQFTWEILSHQIIRVYKEIEK